MVTFATYTKIAYEIAKSKSWYEQVMTGPGSRSANNEFIQQLAEAYNRLDHSEATEAQARQFLKGAVSRP